IGDKVLTHAPSDSKFELDLGAAWKDLTDLPFVFAAWMALPDVDLRDLPQRLVVARQTGLEHLDEIIERYAVPRGWPPSLARQYLTMNLKFEILDVHIRAIELFHQKAAAHGMINSPPRPLNVIQ